MESHSHAVFMEEAGGHNHGGETSSNGEHTHALNAAFQGGGPGKGHDLNPNFGNIAETQPNGNHRHDINTDGMHQHAITIQATGGGETRPRNIALLAMIRY